MIQKLSWIRNLLRSKTTVEIYDRGERHLAGWLITSGKYTGVEYLLGDVTFGANLGFTVQVITNPNDLDTDCDEFTRIVGDALRAHLKSEQKDYKNWLYRKE